MDNGTIIAISSPLGNSLRGIIRLSGPKSFRFVQKVINQPILTKQRWEAVHTDLRIPIAIDHRPGMQKTGNIPATFYLMPAPHSYTREDVVEIHTFGARVLMASIVEFFINKGARLAQPGEFTKRAFLNGRIDLTQTEAVLNIIQSSSEREHHLAVNQLYKHSFSHLKEINRRLLELISKIEIAIDFSDQDIEIISYSQIENSIRLISADIREILQSNRISQSISTDGIICVLCGKPNVGKSSLFNRLVKDRKNIVSAFPGTTRDYIEGRFSYQKTVFRLFDTAGIARKISADTISRKAQKGTENILRQADIYLMIIDGSQEIDKNDKDILKKLDSGKTIVIINKIDLIPKRQPKSEIHNQKSEIRMVSAYTGKGITSLKKAIVKLSDSKPPEGLSDEMLINQRQQENLKLCLESLDKVKTGVSKRLSYEFIAFDLKQTLDSLNSALGIYTSGKSIIADNILDHIFSRFCIGK